TTWGKIRVGVRGGGLHVQYDSRKLGRIRRLLIGEAYQRIIRPSFEGLRIDTQGKSAWRRGSRLAGRRTQSEPARRILQLCSTVPGAAAGIETCNLARRVEPVAFPCVETRAGWSPRHAGACG